MKHLFFVCKSRIHAAIWAWCILPKQNQTSLASVHWTTNIMYKTDTYNLSKHPIYTVITIECPKMLHRLTPSNLRYTYSQLSPKNTCSRKHAEGSLSSIQTAQKLYALNVYEIFPVNIFLRTTFPIFPPSKSEGLWNSNRPISIHPRRTNSQIFSETPSLSSLITNHHQQESAPHYHQIHCQSCEIRAFWYSSLLRAYNTCSYLAYRKLLRILVKRHWISDYLVTPNPSRWILQHISHGAEEHIGSEGVCTQRGGCFDGASQYFLYISLSLSASSASGSWTLETTLIFIQASIRAILTVINSIFSGFKQRSCLRSR